MVPVADVGRRFHLDDRVRLGDVTRVGELQLDALVRYSQIISNDDTNDAGLEQDLAWIARSTVVDVVHPATLDEPLELVTFCAGLGRTWAQRRVTVTGGRGARYDLATLWVSIQPDSMRPRRLSEQFLDIYGPAAQGRKVSAKQRIPRPSTAAIDRSVRLEWAARWGDFDAFGHMNNVVYWSAIQHAVGAEVAAGTRIAVEHGSGVQPGDPSVVLVDRAAPGTVLRMWWLVDGEGVPAAPYSAAAEVRFR